MAANAHFGAGALGGLDQHFQHALHGRVAFVVEVAYQCAVAVQAEGELGEVVAADGEAIDVLAEFLGHEDVAGDLRHQEELKALFAALQAVFLHHCGDALQLFHRAAEGHHHHHVLQAHFFTHASDGLAFQPEGFLVRIAVVAGRAAPADHGVFLVRFEVLAAQKVLVLVAFEVAEAHDHLVGVKGAGDLGDAVAELLYEESLFVLIAVDQVTDLAAERHVAELFVL